MKIKTILIRKAGLRGFLAIGFALSLVGCGSPDDQSQTGSLLALVATSLTGSGGSSAGSGGGGGNSGTTTAPGTPTGVSATTGSARTEAIVSFTAPSSGGSPITGYTVTSVPAGITTSGSASPITVTCPSTCAGKAFTVFATNSVGNGTASSAADIITVYNVLETFHEPDTQPSDSIFTGSFTFNFTTGTVTNLTGMLTESMTGSGTGASPYYDMTQLHLTYQLSSVNNAALGGLLVTTFLNSNTNTFTNNPTFLGTDGWSPGSGYGIYYGFPTGTTHIANPGNAYAMIFVNTADPTTPLTQAQIDKLAYADCAPGGMMGATCMTGTSVAGYGDVGTMSGYPVSQVVTKP